MDFARDWSSFDSALFGSALAATYADDQSTKALKGRGLTEQNPILGKSPSGAAVDTEMAIGAGLAASLAAALPEKYRGAFLGGWTGLEGGLAAHNATLTTKSPQGLGADLSSAAIPAAIGAAAGYFLPKSSGDSGKIAPDIRPGYTGLTYSKGFSQGGMTGPLKKAPQSFVKKLKEHGVTHPAELEVALNSIGHSLYGTG